MSFSAGAIPRDNIERPAGYQYLKILSDHLGGDLSRVFDGKLIYPRQLEIHLPGDHRRACNFACYYCQGRILKRPLFPFEQRALEIVDTLEGKVPYCIYGGAYTEPLLNPRLLEFIKITKRHGGYFGIHTNGSLLKQLEGRQSFLSWICLLAASEKDYLSISLDAGTPESHKRTKSTKKSWFGEIIDGIRLAVKIRGASNYPSIRVCYLLNEFNSSEKEIGGIIDVMREIGVNSLRFSIPYDVYGKSFDRVRKYKQDIEITQDVAWAEMLEPLLSKDARDKPYVFYIPPYYQDVDRMDFEQCIYSYYQITLAADGYVYKCSSTASPTFAMNRLGKITDDLDTMILANHDPDFSPATCFSAGARCNRIALEINTAWNEYQRRLSN